MDILMEKGYNRKNAKGLVLMECCRYESPAGVLWLTGQRGVLNSLSFEKPHGEFVSGNFNAAVHWLDDYFQGISRETDFPMEPSGTPFQKMIWKLLLEIPFGETLTYGQIAKRVASLMGKEKMSSQAVGQAVGRNPIAIMIPCHRVIGADGRLTGYAYGTEKKQWLLDHEQNRR